MISSGFVLALLLAIVGLCESHEIGLHRPPKAKEIRRFALPDDVVVVGMWDSAGVDEELPKEIVEVMCDALESARKCMNVSGHEPLYYGRNCAGVECHTYPYPGPSLCLANITGMQLDFQNITRAATCGLDPEDEAIIQPITPDLGPASSDARKNIVGLPKGIYAHVWNLCLKGEYYDVVRISFDEAPAHQYECKVDPFCINGQLRGGGICYSYPEFLVEYSSAVGCPHALWFNFCVLLIFYLLLVVLA